MLLSTPRLVIAGLAGDSGKTLVALGLIRALSTRGDVVAPVKKGPDYIDAAWLGAAAGLPGRNLDTYLMPPAAIGESFARGADADLVLVEGNRGLFDGLDATGSHSTAGLAKLIRAPVLLVIDVTKMTRTVAALVLGCSSLDPRLQLAGIVLNRVGTQRQENVIREAIERISGPPVWGAIPRLVGDPLPGRHLGLLTAVEHPEREAVLTRVAEVMEAHVDLEAVRRAARTATAVTFPDRQSERPGPAVRVGVFRDEAFSFYYPENLEALVEAGAEIVAISPLTERELPEVDALYLGGGFPEVYADRLADNHSLLKAVREAAGEGMPIYAECGGLIYLARELIVAGGTRQLAGVLDLVVEQTPKPQGHGYVEAEVASPNPFFAKGSRLRGHEFHYSKVVGGADAEATQLRLLRGEGCAAGRDGIVVGRIWASYLHLHALGTPAWAPAFTSLAHAYRRESAALRRGGRSAAAENPGEWDDQRADGVTDQNGRDESGQRIEHAGDDGVSKLMGFQT